MKPIYVFSGLGADRRVFKYLNFGTYRPVFIQWIQPLKDEDITGYAVRLSKQITTEEPALLGLSFGGIVAVETAKLIKTGKLILLSSAKTKKEIPFYYRWAGRAKLHKLLSASLLKKPSFISNWFFGAANPESKKMLAEILRDTDSNFLRWAIHQIVTWNNQSIIAGTVHIHGTKDRILPFRFIEDACPVKQGGHLMTMDKFARVNHLLKNLL